MQKSLSRESTQNDFSRTKDFGQIALTQKEWWYTVHFTDVKCAFYVQDHKQHTLHHLTYLEENKFPFYTPDKNYGCESWAQSNDVYKSSILSTYFRLYN